MIKPVCKQHAGAVCSYILSLAHTAQQLNITREEDRISNNKCTIKHTQQGSFCVMRIKFAQPVFLNCIPFYGIP